MFRESSGNSFNDARGDLLDNVRVDLLIRFHLRRGDFRDDGDVLDGAYAPSRSVTLGVSFGVSFGVSTGAAVSSTLGALSGLGLEDSAEA